MDLRWRWKIDLCVDELEDLGLVEVAALVLGRLNLNSLTVAGTAGSSTRPDEGKTCRHLKLVPPFAGANSHRPFHGEVKVYPRVLDRF